MILKPKHIVRLIGCIFFVWFAWGMYDYIFDKYIPHITCRGIIHNHIYAGEIACTFSTDKDGYVTVILDNSKYIPSTKVTSYGDDFVFTIPTQTLSDGNHLLILQFVDRTYHRNKQTLIIPFSVDNVHLDACVLKPEDTLAIAQGKTLHLVIQATKLLSEAKVHAFFQYFPGVLVDEHRMIYECFIPIACEEMPGEHSLDIMCSDNTGKHICMHKTIIVEKVDFKKSTTTQEEMSSEKIQEENAKGHDEKSFERMLIDLARKSPQKKLWRGPFCTPIDIQNIRCDFGTICTTHYKGRYTHKALDIINQPKSIVWSPHNGVVVLKDRFAMSGNTVVVDHGCGILSIFCHLDDFASLDVGETICQGNPIGTIGKTGYVDDYHLHWEMRIHDIAIDPIEWTEKIY